MGCELRQLPNFVPKVSKSGYLGREILAANRDVCRLFRIGAECVSDKCLWIRRDGIESCAQTSGQFQPLTAAEQLINGLGDEPAVHGLAPDDDAVRVGFSD